MKSYSPITMVELKSLTAQAQSMIGRMRLGVREQQDFAAFKQVVDKLSSLNLIDVGTTEVDLSDEQLRFIAADQNTTIEHAQSVRIAIREIFYQLYHDYLVICVNTPESHNRAKEIASNLCLVAEWACIKVGYSLMYAADGKHACEAEDIFRSMLDRSVAAVFYCAEIHASGLIVNEGSGAHQYDYEEALELFSKNLRPEVLSRQTTYYVRSAIRFAEIVLSTGVYSSERIDFITTVLMNVKTNVCEKKVKISEPDFRKLLSCLTSVLLKQIENTASAVSDSRVAIGLVDVQTARLLLSDLSVASSGLHQVVSEITME